MTVTFQKRQKEMKRLEKAKEKAERRTQKKLAKRAEKDGNGPAVVDDSIDWGARDEALEPFDPETKS